MQTADDVHVARLPHLRREIHASAVSVVADQNRLPIDAGSRQLPLYLEQPEIVFRRIWANPVKDKFLNLAD